MAVCVRGAIVICVLALPQVLAKDKEVCKGHKTFKGEHRVCASLEGADYLFNCPWQTARAVGNAVYGATHHGDSCKAFKFNCKETDVDAVLDTYHKPVKEGASAVEVDFTKCCLQHQCKKGPACGKTPTKCAGLPKPVDSKIGACLSNDDGLSYHYHCPWENANLVSYRDFGGCGHVKYDCLDEDLAAVMKLYKGNTTNAAEDVDKDEVVYTQCCIKHQCMKGPSCGKAPTVHV